MKDSEKLDLILSEMQGMKGEIQGIKGEIQGMKGEIQGMKGEIQGMKGEIQGMKGEIQGMKGDIRELGERVTGIELHLENETDKGVQLLAENFIELTNKLNQAIPAANKNLAYEVKVNYLIDKVKILEEDMAGCKMAAGVI